MHQTDFDKTFTHHTATVNHVSLHYVMGGQGDPLVLLHGWPVTWYSWRKIMPALAEQYSVVAPDLRGFGDSEKPAAGYDKRTLAEDIYQLMRHLGFEKIYLVGHDMGAPVAYTYAAEHRADVRRLVILDVPMNGFGLDEFARKQHVWHIDFFQVPDLPEALITGRERTFIHWVCSAFYHPAAITEADIAEYVRCYSTPGAIHAGLECYRAFPQDEQQFNAYSQQKLEMPVLAIGGENSGGAFPFSSLTQLAKNVRGEIIKDCGHFIAEEQPEVLTQQLLAFLGEKQGKSTGSLGNAHPPSY